MWRIGLDVGGTKIEGVLLKEELNGTLNYKKKSYSIQTQLRIPTQRSEGKTKVILRIKELIIELLEKNHLKPKDIDSIGIGLPGSIDPHSRQMLNGNTSLFVGVDLKNELRVLLQTPLEIEIYNDANCFAWAEVVLGCGRKFSLETSKIIGVGLILGTGQGGGLVSYGNIVEGAHGGALEVGHTRLIENGPKCFCGRNGCAETLISGTGISQRYEVLTGEKVLTKEIFSRNDEFSRQVRKETKEYLSEHLANLCNILDPHFFVLGGGVANGDFLYEGLEELVAEKTFLPNMRPKIYKHSLGDYAGVFGAALLPLV